MPAPDQIRQLLHDLRGCGFRVRIMLEGADLIGLKVVSVDRDLVYTVDAAGNVGVLRIDLIHSVTY